MSDALIESDTPQWRIELCERPVKLGGTVDHLFFKKPLSHPFLALIDPDNSVRGEIHGIPFDETTQTLRKTKLNVIFELSTMVSTPLYADKAIYALIALTPLRSRYPTLKSVFFDKAKQYDRASERQVILSADHDAVNTLWDDLKKQALKLNDLHLVYSRYANKGDGNSCQTTIATVLNRLGFNDVAPTGNLATPGWKVLPLPQQ